MNPMYDWVRDIFRPMWPEIEDLTDQTPDAEATVRRWFERLLRRLEERGITLQSMKNHVVAVRNEVRQLAPDHFCLPFITFESDQWTAINIPGEEALAQRIQNQKLLPNPWGIIEQADKLLASRHWPEVTVGLAVSIGRRISELLSANTVLSPCTEYSVLFRGQLKQRSDRADEPDPEFEIPTLVSAANVLAAWERLRKVVGVQRLHPRKINNKYGPAANDAADQAFVDLVPLREGEERRYIHLYRAVYATLAVYLYCPVRVNAYLFKAEIQGHRKRFENAGTVTQRVSVASQLHYDDYKVATEDGTNIDGRQGLALDRPGVQTLRVFQRPGNDAPFFPELELDGGVKTASAPEPTPEQDGGTASAGPETMPSDSPAEEPAATPTMEAPEPIPAFEPSPEAAPTPASSPELSVEKVRHPRPVTYRVYPDDATRLNSFKLDPKESQAENLHRLLERADQDRASGESLAKLEVERAGMVTDLETAQAARHALEAVTAEQQTLLAAAAESDRRLNLELTQARRDVRALAQTLLGAAQETSDDDHAIRLTALAGEILGWPLLRSRRTEAAPVATASAPVLPKHSLPTEAGVPPVNQVQADGAAPVSPVQVTPEVVDPGGPQTPPVPSTIKREAPPALQRLTLSRSQLAQDKIDRSVRATIAHNTQEQDASKRFAITPKAIGHLTGCFAPAIARYFENEENRQTIEAHNTEFGLSKASASWQGRRGIFIKDLVKLPELDLEGSAEGPGEDGHPF